MTLRENEREDPRRQDKPTTPSALALEIVRDDPKALKTKLARRWVRQIQGDEDLLSDYLEAQSSQEIQLAFNTLAREQARAQAGKGKVKVKAHQRKRHAFAQLMDTISATRQTLFGFVAENGKRIGDLTGAELSELESRNTTRAGLYRELGNPVGINETVGDALDDKALASIIGKLGDVQDLGKLFA